jgi:hypothetical protein
MDVASILLIVIKSSIVLTVLGLGLNATWQDATSLLRQPGLLIRSTVLIIAGMAVFGPIVGHALGGPDPDNRTVLALSTTSRHPAIALASAVAAGAETKSELEAIPRRKQQPVSLTSLIVL